MATRHARGRTPHWSWGRGAAGLCFPAGHRQQPESGEHTGPRPALRRQVGSPWARHPNLRSPARSSGWTPLGHSHALPRGSGCGAPWHHRLAERGPAAPWSLGTDSRLLRRSWAGRPGVSPAGLHSRRRRGPKGTAGPGLTTHPAPGQADRCGRGTLGTGRRTRGRSAPPRSPPPGPQRRPDPESSGRLSGTQSKLRPQTRMWTRPRLLPPEGDPHSWPGPSHGLAPSPESSASTRRNVPAEKGARSAADAVHGTNIPPAQGPATGVAASRAETGPVSGSQRCGPRLQAAGHDFQVKLRSAIWPGALWWPLAGHAADALSPDVHGVGVGGARGSELSGRAGQRGGQ